MSKLEAFDNRITKAILKGRVVLIVHRTDFEIERASLIKISSTPFLIMNSIYEHLSAVSFYTLRVPLD